MKFTDITVTRTIPASSDKVFDLWMNPKSPGGPWFGAERVILNPVVDGLFYIAVKHEGRILAALRTLPSDRSASPGRVHMDVRGYQRRRVRRDGDNGTTRRRDRGHAPSLGSTGR